MIFIDVNRWGAPAYHRTGGSTWVRWRRSSCHESHITWNPDQLFFHKPCDWNQKHEVHAASLWEYTLNIHYNTALTCSQYNVCSDWLLPGHYSPVIPICQLLVQKQSKKPHNNQLINLACSVFTGTSQTSAWPYWSFYGKVSVWDFLVKTSLSVNECIMITMQ